MKDQEKFIIIISAACFLSAMFIGGLTAFLVQNDGAVNLIENALAGIKLCIGAIFIQCLFIWLLNCRCKTEDSTTKYNFRFASKVFDTFKCIGFLVLASFAFHTVAVLFGAPFFESSAETYHFAVLLTIQVCLPFCLFLGLDVNSWLNIFTESSTDGALEVMVYFTSLFSVLGGWLGAIPIPLDWDRPWQVWPISCVIGALFGYAAGLLLASVFIPRQYRAKQKSKFF